VNGSHSFLGCVVATLAGFFASHHGGASHGWTVTVTAAAK
jgi:hypothetical protein